MSRTYEVIAAKITEMLEQGTIPWKRPWRTNSAVLRSYQGRDYRGINLFLLNAWAQAKGLKGCWLTFNQVQKLGGKVRKGEKGCPVVFWKFLDEVDNQGKETGKTIPLCRYYTVFSIDQCEGIEEPAWVAKLAERTPVDPIEAAEAIWAKYPGRPEFLEGGNEASYSPKMDRIQMPERDFFRDAASYYATLFHEATHSTGHASRLERFKDNQASRFGTETYSREELVAEMGAAFLCGEAGIEDTRTIENAAAYIKGWLKAIKDDPRAVVIAAAQAQKAADLILNKKAEKANDGSAE
jgi:antirestriction protein ArdC